MACFSWITLPDKPSALQHLNAIFFHLNDMKIRKKHNQYWNLTPMSIQVISWDYMKYLVFIKQIVKVSIVRPYRAKDSLLWEVLFISTKFLYTIFMITLDLSPRPIQKLVSPSTLIYIESPINQYFLNLFILCSKYWNGTILSLYLNNENLKIFIYLVHKAH